MFAEAPAFYKIENGAFNYNDDVVLWTGGAADVAADVDKMVGIVVFRSLKVTEKTF